MEPKYILIPLISIPIWDTPRSKAEGALKRRDGYIGFPLKAYETFIFNGVEYAWLVPNDPNKPEWVRIAEAGGTPKYVEKVEINPGNDTIISLLKEILAVLKWKS